MYHPRLYGDYYDMGFKYGSLLFEKAGFQLPKMELRKETFGTIWSFNLHMERAESKPKNTNFITDTRLSWWLNKRNGSI